MTSMDVSREKDETLKLKLRKIRTMIVMCLMFLLVSGRAQQSAVFDCEQPRITSK